MAEITVQPVESKDMNTSDRPIRTPRNMWEDIINTDLTKIVSEIIYRVD
jgi:hypothetical protein